MCFTIRSLPLTFKKCQKNLPISSLVYNAQIKLRSKTILKKLPIQRETFVTIQKNNLCVTHILTFYKFINEITLVSK